MRKFHSYGPIDKRYNYCVDRKKIIQKCSEQLIGIPEEGGHYFTIWAPRQTGKTWIIRQCIKSIRSIYEENFIVAELSMQPFVFLDHDDFNNTFFGFWKDAIYDKFKIDLGAAARMEKLAKSF